VAVQVSQGKAFEYACLDALRRHLSSSQEIVVTENESVHHAEDAYNTMQSDVQGNMRLAAEAAVKVLVRLEPQLENPLRNVPLLLEIQPDKEGQAGDVRDVLAIRRQNNWEIGLSTKHNHSAVKHSRLSRKLDFGKKWLGIPCSKEYFADINPVFNELDRLASEKALFEDIHDKAGRIYLPVLQAFLRELNRLSEKHAKVVPTRLLAYLLGTHDFYKVIARTSSRTTQIQVFSLYGTLNRPAGTIQPQVRIPKLHLPTSFETMKLKPGSETTAQIVCDKGWTISARLHNARKVVEPSLKFDIGLTGVPQTLYTHHEPW